MLDFLGLIRNHCETTSRKTNKNKHAHTHIGEKRKLRVLVNNYGQWLTLNIEKKGLREIWAHSLVQGACGHTRLM